MKQTLCFLTLFLCFITSSLRAQVHKEVRIDRASDLIIVDGNLDEKTWEITREVHFDYSHNNDTLLYCRWQGAPALFMVLITNQVRRGPFLGLSA